MSPVREGSWIHPSRVRRLRLLARIAPRYIQHLLFRPYRVGITDAHLPNVATRARARLAAAAIDAWVHELLVSYSEITSARLDQKGSGRLAIRYIRLMAAINREFEHRLATGHDLRLEQVAATSSVASRIIEWEQFAALHHQEREVVGILARGELNDDYERYIAVTTAADFTADIELQLESIRLDSGGYLVRLVHLVEQFNHCVADPAVIEEFRQLGMAAKLADELADLMTDHAEGRYNLLLTLLQQNPGEHALAMSRLEHSLPMPLSWWLTSAPRSFGRFSELYEEHRRRLRSPALRVICDTTMLRALGGPRPRQSARAAQHVSEPPGESWR